MKKSRINFISWLVVFLFVSSPLAGENISFKISYNTASVSKGDLNTWIDSYNALWKDGASMAAGQLDGQFNPIKYGPKYEVELRIPILSGFALNLSGCHFSSIAEGTVSFIHETSNQTETDHIRNEVKGYPIKIGLSYTPPLSLLENLHVFAGIGRHITFINFKSSGDFYAELKDINGDFTYSFKRDYDSNSEALGFYATLGVEYDIIKHIAIVAEAEKVWSKADGFKGQLNEEHIETNPGEGPKITYEESDKASLYFYEYKRGGDSKYYSYFRGNKEKPDIPKFYPRYPRGITDIKNIRQGELDLSTFSIKIGIRFKF